MRLWLRSAIFDSAVGDDLVRADEVYGKIEAVDELIVSFRGDPVV